MGSAPMTIAVSRRRRWWICGAIPLTKPTPGMLEAMVAAPLGDDVYSEDPTVNRLQERVAGLFGKGGGALHPHRLHVQPVGTSDPRPSRR